MTEIKTEETEKKEICGIVMPISGIDGCDEVHWTEVLNIIKEACENAGFFPNIVSNSDDVTIIHKNIIQNLYENPIVVCDVSGKNPNVMFELGLRLAFNKPTIIIKDDKTSYSFDTSAIEHIEYPRDLRFSKIVAFKEKLAEKISATYQKSITDPNYTTFLKHFGEFKVAKLDKREVSGQEFILEELQTIKGSLRKIENSKMDFERSKKYPFSRSNDVNLCLGIYKEEQAKKALEIVKKLSPIKNAMLTETRPNHWHIYADVDDKSIDIREFEDYLDKKVSDLVGNMYSSTNKKSSKQNKNL